MKQNASVMKVGKNEGHILIF